MVVVLHGRPRITAVPRPIQTSGKGSEETLPVFIGVKDVSALNASGHDVEEGRCWGKAGFARHFVNIYLALRHRSYIECRVNRTDGRPLNYTWTATGGVDYLQPMDSACIFTAPSCHTGPATVTVVVSDDSVSTTASVDINREQ